MVSTAPDTAITVARTFRPVIFSFKNRAASINMNMVDIWFKTAAFEIAAYFMPAIQNNNAK